MAAMTLDDARAEIDAAERAVEEAERCWRGVFLNDRQRIVLQALRHHGPITAAELAKQLRDHPDIKFTVSNVCASLSALRKRGFTAPGGGVVQTRHRPSGRQKVLTPLWRARHSDSSG